MNSASNTSFARMGGIAFGSVLLLGVLSAGSAAAQTRPKAPVTTPAPTVPRSAPVDAADADPFDGSGPESGEFDVQAIDPALQKSPFGAHTIAVIRTDRGIYAFGSFDANSIEVLEVLPPGKESLVAHALTTREVLGRLLGEQHAEPVERSIISLGGSPVAMPLELAVHDDENDDPQPVVAFCDSSDAWVEDYVLHLEIWSDQFTCGGPPYEGLTCMQYRAFVSDSGAVGWSQRSSDQYDPTDDGTCATYGRVLSCNGSTLFRAYWRDNGGDGWSQTLNYWVGSGTTAVHVRFSNENNNPCRSGDRDHFRFRADSEPGASHQYGYGFMHKSVSIGPCEACD